MKKITVSIALILILQACSYNASFRQDFVPITPSISLSQKLDGKGLIVMSSLEENYIYSDNPASFTGGGTKLTLPLGLIVKQISMTVFDSIFSKGVYFSNSSADTSGYLIVIKPDIRIDNYKYDQLENLGFAVTPKVSISANIEVQDNNNSVIFTKDYSYIDLKAPAYLFAASPDEKVNELIHQAIHKIMLESLSDIRNNLIDS
jgi:hypothetical protein|tara:strand:- start:1798 stop:2409 length:612 start_codon:yes stop_codon:yes gene_type:complete